MKIRKLQLENIGVFDDETIEFQPCPAKDKAEIHIFTGQNGSGKSTILATLAGIFDDTEDRRGLDFKHIKYLRNFLYKRFRNFEYINYINEDYSSKAIAQFPDGDSLTIFGCPTCESIHQTRRYTHDSSKSSIRKLDSFSFQLDSEYQNYELEFAVFAFSGYRQVENERVEAIKEPKGFNPLYQALDFVKDYNQANELTINQLIANNISKGAIERDRNPKKSEKFAKVLSSIEQIIFEITGWKVEFDLQTEPICLITKINDEKRDLDVLPDGLRSLISWIADLLGRVDLLKWRDDLPIFEKNLILLLDEIEVHLHPAWQRKVLPVVQKLFKNSQIFVSTHSPFVVNSIDDAWVYKLELENGKAKVGEPIKSEDAISYQTVLSEIFGIEEEFGGKAQDDLNKFYSIVRNGKKIDEKELKKLAKSLAVQSEELNSIVQIELRQLSRRKGKEFSI